MNKESDNERRLALLKAILALQKVRQPNFRAGMIQYESNQASKSNFQSRRNAENTSTNEIMP